ncbi:TPA: hypothetical protein RQJ57_000064 [Vibrio vulnificus]|nr:hypothetical protein [Vibrio vulnificus]
MKLRMGVLALAMSFNALADFQTNEYFDGMYYKNVYEEYTTNNGNRLGFRCDSGRRNRSFYLTFEGNQFVSNPNYDVTVKIKVDSKQIHTFTSRMYSSSNVSGECSKAIAVSAKRWQHSLPRGVKKNSNFICACGLEQGH